MLLLTARAVTAVILLGAGPAGADSTPSTDVRAETPPAAQQLAEALTEGSGLTSEVIAKLSPDQLESVLIAHQSGNDGDELQGILVPGMFFLLLALVVALPLTLRHREALQRQETLRLMVEKGSEIPEQMLVPPERKRSSDLRRGILIVSAGLGLMVFFALVAGNEGVWSLGLIPVLIGCGYLITHRLEGRTQGA